MIIVDANILIYAHHEKLPQHRAARAWLDTQLGGSARVGLPWPSILAFLRIATHPKLFSPPESAPQAWLTVGAWLGCANVWVPVPGEGHADVLAKCLAVSGVAGNLIYDAHLAALAIEHGLTLCSTDTDFARFPQLKWLNPLTP